MAKVSCQFKTAGYHEACHLSLKEPRVTHGHVITEEYSLSSVGKLGMKEVIQTQVPQIGSLSISYCRRRFSQETGGEL